MLRAHRYPCPDLFAPGRVATPSPGGTVVLSQRPGMSPSTQDSLDWVGLYPTGRRDVLEPHSGVALSRCFPLSVNQRALVTRRSGSQITIGAGLQSPRSQAGIWPDGGSGEGERPGYGAAGVRHRTGATAPAGRDGAEGLNQWRGGGHRPREPHNCSLIWPATAAPLRTSRTPTTATRRSASGARFDGIYVSCLRCKEAGGILLVVAQGGRPAAGGLRYRSGGTRGGQAALPVLRTAYCGGELADYPRRNGQHRVQRLLEVRRRLRLTPCTVQIVFCAPPPAARQFSAGARRAVDDPSTERSHTGPLPPPGARRK